jgi:hypothetical protein
VTIASGRVVTVARVVAYTYRILHVTTTPRLFSSSQHAMYVAYFFVLEFVSEIQPKKAVHYGTRKNISCCRLLDIRNVSIEQRGNSGPRSVEIRRCVAGYLVPDISR